jgi:thymidine kinase
MVAQENKGKLELIIGPMYAGKTTRLLQLYEKAPGILIKPAIDERYSRDEIVTHDGKRYKAIPCKGTLDIASIIDPYIKNPTLRNDSFHNRLYIDEVQFFDGLILPLISAARSFNIDIYAAGLDLTFEKEPFPFKNSFKTMQDLIDQSTKIHHLMSQCYKCGDPAPYTKKIGTGKDIVEVGGKELYQPACKKHHPNLYDLTRRIL